MAARIPSTTISTAAALCCLVLGCQHASVPFTLPLFRWSLYFKLTIHDFGPGPAEVNVAEAGMDALAAANQDGFFPPDTIRALVSQEALAAGLFNPRDLPASALPGSSPDQQWSIELGMTGGVQNLVELTRVRDAERRYFWSTGVFQSLYWSPNSQRFGLNEIRSNGRRNAFLVDVLNMEQQYVPARTHDFSPFLSPEQLRVASQNEIRGWLNDALFIYWVHGDPDQHGLPRWGYELVVDATVVEPDLNAHVLRAFVRSPLAVSSAP